MKPSSEKAKSASKVSSRGSLEGRSKSIPKLRFPGFKGEWKCQIFGSAFDFIPNNTLSRSELTHGNGSVKNVHYGDILVKFGAVIDFEHDAVPFIVNRSVSASERRLRDGDVIIADTAEDETVGKASEVFGIKNVCAEAGLHTMACRPKREFAPRFMGYYLNSTAYHHRLLPLMQGIKVFSLSKSQISKTEIYIPCDEAEQRQIADFLSLLDSRITAQRKLVELLKKQKRGLQNSILEGRCRILNQGGDAWPEWRKVRIGDIFQERSERGGTTNELLSVTINGGVKRQVDTDKKDNSSEDKSNYKNVIPGDIVYNTMRMWQGASGVSPWAGIVSPAYTVLYPRYTENTIFWAYAFKHWRLVHEFQKFSQGLTSDTWNLKYPQLSDIHVRAPSLDEQAAIVNLLSMFDVRVEKAECVLEKMHNLKTGLLQQLFV